MVTSKLVDRYLLSVGKVSRVAFSSARRETATIRLETPAAVLMGLREAIGSAEWYRGTARRIEPAVSRDQSGASGIGSSRTLCTVSYFRLPTRASTAAACSPITGSAQRPDTGSCGPLTPYSTCHRTRG